MELKTEAHITQIIEIEDNETKEKTYLIETDNDWTTITEEEYKQILNGEDINGE